MERFIKIVAHAHEIQLNHLKTLQGRISSSQGKCEEVNVSKDQDLFATYNIRVFAAPSDWKFESSAIHYDTVSISSTVVYFVIIRSET